MIAETKVAAAEMRATPAYHDRVGRQSLSDKLT